MRERKTLTLMNILKKCICVYPSNKRRIRKDHPKKSKVYVCELKRPKKNPCKLFETKSDSCLKKITNGSLVPIVMPR
jgi:hypothetical protein